MFTKQLPEFKLAISIIVAVIIIMLSLSLAECTSDVPLQQQTTNFTALDLKNAQASQYSGISFDEMAPIPIGNTVTSSKSKPVFSLHMYNDSDKTYTINAINLQTKHNINNTIAPVPIALNSRCGNLIMPNSNCMILLTPQVTTGNHDAFIVARLSDDSGKPITVRQELQLSDKLGTNYGLTGKPSQILNADREGYYSAAIPYILNEDFDSLSLDARKIKCNNNDTTAGTACTAFIDGQLPPQQESMQLITPIIAYQNGKNLEIPIKYTVINRPTTSSYLLMSYATEVRADKDNGAASLTIFNRGADAQNLSFYFDYTNNTAISIDAYKLNGKNDSTNCTTIVSQGSCEITLKLKNNANINGTSTFYVKENGEIKNSTLVYYYADSQPINLGFKADNSKNTNTMIGN